MTMEEKLIKSETIKFLPYIGENYFNSNQKILVLGESHYGSQKMNSYPMWTRDVIEKEYLQDLAKGIKNSWIKCFRTTAEILTGKEYSCSDYIWKDIAFYNFFQETVGDSNPRDKKYITAELIEKSRMALKDVLEILNPDVVVVWGWGKLMTTWLPIERIKLKETPYIFTINEYPPVPFWCMMHPSSPRLNRKFLKKLWNDVQVFLSWK